MPVRLTGNNFSSFPEVLTRCEGLRQLSMRNNKLSSIPEELPYLENLEVNISFPYIRNQESSLMCDPCMYSVHADLR